MGLGSFFDQYGPTLLGGTAGFMLGGPMGALAGAGVGNMMTQNQMAQQNFGLSQEQFEYQKQLQQTMFQREDNSIQRRVSDLQAAGLSPVLAAGQGASAGSVISTSAPQRQITDNMSMAPLVMAAIKMKNDISMTDAQKELIETQKLLNTSSISKNLIESQAKSYDLNYYKNKGLPTNATGLTKDIAQMFGLTSNTTAQQESKNLINKINDILKPAGDRKIEQEKLNKAHDDREAQRLKK